MNKKIKLVCHVAHLTFSLFLICLFTSCHFWQTITGTITDTEDDIEITSLTLGKSSLTMKAGSMDYILVNVKPQTVQKKVNLHWSYDENIISCDTSSAWGITITALKEGQTTLKCSYGGYDAVCLITVSGFSDNYESTTEPYIYSNTTVLQTSPGITERVYVSLYGGDAGDIDGYTWTVDNSSVASIQPTGQYCLITAKNSGYTRIKITHTKAAYPYYMGIYVFEDATNITYITTSSNILTMNQDDGSQTVSVSLVNAKDSFLDSSFKWEIVKDDTSSVPVTLSYNGNTAVISPLKSDGGGTCTVRVSHPDALYPLDILCRVITVVKNVYIAPDNTIVNLNGDEEKTITCSLENITEGEYSIDDYNYILDDYNVAEIVNYIGNKVVVRGKANGSCKLVISHPKAAYTREVLLIIQGQLTDAVDASCYITTSQNYIRTKIGEDTTCISISLKGGEDTDENGFVWNVKNSPVDGTSDVIKLETTNGSVVTSRSASMTYAYGNAYITPNAEGSAIISISHPKILYPTEILVKVLSKDAILTEPLYFSGSGILKIVNGESAEYTVELKGKNKKTSDDENITFSAEDSRVSIASSANTVQVTAPTLGSGKTVSYINISHPKCDSDKKVLLLTADDSDTLSAMQALYSDKLYYNIEAGESAALMVSATGFNGTYDEESETYTPYDFSSATWTVKNSSICTVEKVEGSPLSAVVRGLKAGSTTVTVTLEDTTCDFTITVYPKGSIATDPEVYFTTSQNVVSLGEEGKTASVKVSAINLSSSEYSNITWQSDNEEIASVIANGTSATITAVGEGTCIISVSHKDSQNTLKIYVRVGSEYVISQANPVVYISATDVMTLLKDQQSQQLQAVLVNYTGEDTSGFSFSIDNEEVAKISAQTQTGIAYIKPVKSGQAELTITHTKSTLTKKVLILVGNSEEELAGLTYLTTNSNVVAVGEGNTKTVNVSVKNSDTVVIDGYSWTSSNPSAVDVTASGASAVLTGNGIGTAMITVTNKACKYSLTIIAQCVDPVAASQNPYIQLTSSVLTLTVNSTYTNITADLVGGSEDDYSDFIWSTNDSTVCAVYGQNQVGKVRALKEGTTYITVSHPKAMYTAQILVVCDKKTESECYISVPSSILTLKPTDSSQTINASLINGSETDKYNFKWTVDVYDIVDMQYSANVCTITPKQSGSCTITVSHPKSSYDQQIIVNVQEYTSFAFPYTNTTVTQGTATFITMQVPVTKVTTHVEYSVDNENICSLSGTKAVAQLQAIKSGTTTVRAKLVASSTGVVQAESEMMVYVKEKATDSVYITAGTTIFTVQKGKSQTLSASLSGTGVEVNDSASLKWTTSDSDIIGITGISTDGTVTGSQIYITAKKSGEALITCSHEKAASDLQFYVIVPGSGEKAITLNKTYMTLTKGSSGSTIKASIENAESTNEYYDIVWTCTDASGNGKEIARVMGNGQTVTIYPVTAGEALLTAQLPDVEKVANCTVIVQNSKSFTFERSSLKVMPFHSTKVKYTVSPPDALLTWTTNADDDYFEYTDLGVDENGEGYVLISGIKEGSGSIYCVTDGSAKGSLTVRTSWDYSFSIDTQKIAGKPGTKTTVNYSVNPPEADLTITGCDDILTSSITKTSEDSSTGTITIETIAEGNGTLKITATNPSMNNEIIGSATISVNSIYSKLSPRFTLISDTAINGGGQAYYSTYTGGTLYIGDGEKVTVKVDVEEEYAQPTYTLKSSLKEITVQDNLTSNGTFTIISCDDYTEDCYQITEGYAPTYNGSRTYSNGTYIKPEDFEYTWASSGVDDFYFGIGYYLNGDFYYRNTKEDTKVYIWSFPGAGKGQGSNNDCYYWGWLYGQTTGVSINSSDICDSNGWGRIRDKSLDGKCYSVAEFQSKLWYYFPDFTTEKSWKGHNTLKITHSKAEINTNHISAKYLQYSLNTGIYSEVNAGNLQFSIEHEGKTQKVIIPVYLSKRKCFCTYKE